MRLIHRDTIGSPTAVAGAIVLCALVGPQVAEAQRWGRPTAPPAGVCFYQDANFQGDYFRAGAGRGRDPGAGRHERPDLVDSDRSGDTEVTIFQDSRFRGRSEQFRGTIFGTSVTRGGTTVCRRFASDPGMQGPRDRFQSRGNGAREGAASPQIPIASSVARTRTSSAANRTRPACVSTAVESLMTTGPRIRFVRPCGAAPSTVN